MKFCDGCGAPVGQQTPPIQQQSAPNTPPPVYQQNTSNFSAEDKNNKVIFVLSYLGILFFLPLVICPNSSVGKFHANQGLILLLVSIAGSIVFAILTAIVWALGFLSTIYSLAMLALAIYGMVNAYNEKLVPLPVIGKLFTLIK